MKICTIAATLLLAATAINSYARDNKEFSAFARTKDSLMHIAYYDKDLARYKKTFGEIQAGYSKLNAKDKEAFKDYISEEQYYLALAYARAGDKKNALTNLEHSKLYDYEDLQTDTTLNILRKEPRFIAYMNVAKNKKTQYQETLQKDAKYNEAEQNTLPAFTYQAASDPNLVALKEKFNLDSIAGSGNDVSKIINLMEWVHYLIPHDGSQGNPKTKNAMSFIKVCTRDKKSLNCRGLGIVLNEVYLAEGFKSRFITCLPKDTTDNDCHVITMVWSSSLKKWLWMDPTFMAYVMNENGEMLSIEEVRDRLVHDKPLILNPDANRNHATSQTKSDYLGSYMSKNLYKLECPISSEYDYETYEEGKSRSYIQLQPGTAPPSPRISKNEHGVDVYSLYYTNNPNTFWAAPPVTANNTAAKEKKHTAAEYEEALGKLKDNYNKKSASGMNDIVISEFRDWDEKKLDGLNKHFGSMISYKFIGMEADNHQEDVALFKIEWSNKTVKCMGISLNNDNKIGTLRFSTYSNYIDWVLAKAIDKEGK